VNKFSDYLEKKFLDWQQQSGKRRSLNEFAEYLGIKRPLLSLWLSGARTPGEEKLKRLGELLGLDVYDAMDGNNILDT
jgi:transcriptional regulator with XRE-family HTH domain